jgi:intracellular septation protein A
MNSRQATPPAPKTLPKTAPNPPRPAKLLMTQLLPLLVFIVVDALVTDTRISILCAIAFAVGQLGVTYATTRRFEWLVLLDVGLIVLFGGISVAFDDELFFKVKPAILEALSIAFMVGLMLAPTRFLQAYLGRMMPALPRTASAWASLKSMLGVMCLGMAVHSAAVVYTAFHSTKPVWAFVSGPGFYLVIVPLGLVLGLAMRARQHTWLGPADRAVSDGVRRS